ncbi:hypothetical protein J6590_008125 [Homalodisca vitripennis]|nr:hypothetical protein J6590_008125 [Homalodisca vitripennis]
MANSPYKQTYPLLTKSCKSTTLPSDTLNSPHPLHRAGDNDTLLSLCLTTFPEVTLALCRDRQLPSPLCDSTCSSHSRSVWAMSPADNCKLRGRNYQLLNGGTVLVVLHLRVSSVTTLLDAYFWKLRSLDNATECALTCPRLARTRRWTRDTSSLSSSSQKGRRL